MSENTIVLLRRLRAQISISSITATMVRARRMTAPVHVKMIVSGRSAEKGGFKQSIYQSINQSINQSIDQGSG